MNRELLKFSPSALATTPTRRALFGLAAALGLSNLPDAEAKKRGKKRKNKNKKKRCPRGEIREGTVCATVCETHEDCGDPPFFCNSLADHSARVCSVDRGTDPSEWPTCPSRSANECEQGEVCVDIAMYVVCAQAA